MAELRDKATAHQAETRDKLAEILAADQLDRLRQIRLQVAGLAALRDAEVIEALGITEEQQAQIARCSRSKIRPDANWVSRRRKKTVPRSMRNGMAVSKAR